MEWSVKSAKIIVKFRNFLQSARLPNTAAPSSVGHLNGWSFKERKLWLWVQQIFERMGLDAPPWAVDL
jgi:hypothetical protein